MNIVVELKRGAHPNTVLNRLYKYTPLQTTFGAQLLALVNGEPLTLPSRSPRAGVKAIGSLRSVMKEVKKLKFFEFFFKDVKMLVTIMARRCASKVTDNGTALRKKSNEKIGEYL